MQIISWNVNGLRACIKKGLYEVLDSLEWDMFHIQETKISEDVLLDHELYSYLSEKYNVYYHCATRRKGYSGVMTLTKEPVTSNSTGIGDETYDSEGRVLTLEYLGQTFINSYFPHTGRDLSRLDHKMGFNHAFLDYVSEMKTPPIIFGDINVAHTEMDIARAKQNKGNAGFTQIEREYFSELLDSGYVDSFRHLHPNTEKYTWWLQNFKARERNVGWRIDYGLVPADLSTRISRAEILDYIHGSDHCPLSLELDL
jgi:exodeoxyribonuclease-3